MRPDPPALASLPAKLMSDPRAEINGLSPFVKAVSLSCSNLEQRAHWQPGDRMWPVGMFYLAHTLF